MAPVPSLRNDPATPASIVGRVSHRRVPGSHSRRTDAAEHPAIAPQSADPRATGTAAGQAGAGSASGRRQTSLTTGLQVMAGRQRSCRRFRTVPENAAAGRESVALRPCVGLHDATEAEACPPRRSGTDVAPTERWTKRASPPPRTCRSFGGDRQLDLAIIVPGYQQATDRRGKNIRIEWPRQEYAKTFRVRCVFLASDKHDLGARPLDPGPARGAPR